MPHENTRSIIEITDGSYAITLPKAWLRFYKVKAKDKVLVISDGKIVIFPPKKTKKTSLSEKEIET